jgi:TolA-binding protein
MSKKDTRLSSVEKLAKNLSAIAENIEIIEIQDSLLRIGSLSESEQIEYAKKVIEDQKENEATSKAKGEQKPQSIASKMQQARSSRRASTLKSDFFAYDPGSLNKGKEEFKDKWGERSLQPNWRRSEALRISARPTESKEEITEDEDENSEEAAIQEILNSLLNNPESIASANDKIENAYFKLGKLYRDNLENYEKSIEAYETLLRRFPESTMTLDVLYYLYLSYLDLPDVNTADRYKNDLISGYPDSEYGKLLSDPSYAKSILAEQKSLSKYYDEMYQRFSAGDYTAVDKMMSESESKFGDTHELRPKFALLSAMTKGKLEGKEAYIKGLQEVVTKFPGTAERTRAREILRFLRGDESAFDAVDINAVDDLFEMENDKLHYIAIVVFNSTPELFDETQLSISEYNKKYHKLKRLQLADITLNRSENIEIILVRKFSDKLKAMEYYNDVIKRPRTYVTNNEVSYDVYPVTQRNYRKILEEKGINKYRGWFEKNYLNPEEEKK